MPQRALTLLLLMARAADIVGWTTIHARSRWTALRLAPNADVPDDEMDLLEYFDPLLSPHMYPRGIDAHRHRGNKQQQQQLQQLAAGHVESIRASFPSDVDVDFDPTLSPHRYPRGTDAGPEEDASRMIGILLIDHGSRRDSSNQQLQLLAQRYQQRLPSNYRVYASHMELASPTIQQGIHFLAQIPGMTTILCHPYFLSPGRHVTEDVPLLIQQAVQSMDKVRFIPQDSTDPLELVEYTPDTIHLYLTPAVGSDLDLILNVVDQSVQQTLQDIETRSPMN